MVTNVHSHSAVSFLRFDYREVSGDGVTRKARGHQSVFVEALIATIALLQVRRAAYNTTPRPVTPADIQAAKLLQVNPVTAAYAFPSVRLPIDCVSGGARGTHGGDSAGLRNIQGEDLQRMVRVAVCAHEELATASSQS